MRIYGSPLIFFDLKEAGVACSETNMHELAVKFHLPIVGDGVIWKNPQNRKDGYKFKRGKLTKSVVVKKKIHAGLL